MKHLNEKVLQLIKDVQDTLKNDPEFAEELIRDLTRISNLLLSKELKQFGDGNSKTEL